MTDTGVGILSEDIEAIFSPFQQVGNPYAMPEGTGLGLAISNRLVKMMGGELHVESQYGAGSTFWFELEIPSIENRQELTEENEAKVIGYQGPKRKILVVDDKFENRAVFRNMLFPLGFDLMEAINGIEGIDKARYFQPDLILMDLVMPELDGYTAAQHIRQIPEIKDTVIIIAVSASAFGENRQRSLDAGCDGFLSKPFRFETLLQEMQELLNLTWVYQDEIGTQQEAEKEQLILPSTETLQALFALAQKGQIVDLDSELEQLKLQNSIYVPFANEFSSLLKGFKLREIRQRLEVYLNRAE